ncbi:response regulator [Calidithermus chliarophilus]|uniref:response regulator n=1 Tax=Calidithermus chliarophilus TaxID=52023 RepID=UPI00040E7320|nr:response regulator [Calidithermus chliarophilus]
MMPGLDGYALLRRLRGRGLRVLVLSAKDEAESGPGDLEGADAYLAKPARLEELLEAVERLSRAGRKPSPPGGDGPDAAPG